MGVEVQDERVGEGCREDQWRAFDRQDEVWVQQAGDVVRVRRAKRGRDRGLDGGEADHDDRLRVVEGRRGVQTEIERLVARRGEAGNVLVLRGVDGGDDVGEIDESADVGRVVAAGGQAGVRRGVDEIGRGAGRK